MDEDRTSYPYRCYTITTFREAGMWWARARVAEIAADGDRSVQGGPWKGRPEAKAAAEAFCNCGKAR